jgi:hypothetical protein
MSHRTRPAGRPTVDWNPRQKRILLSCACQAPVGCRIRGPLTLVSPTGAAVADGGSAYGPELEGFDYPWPISHFPVRLSR